VDLIIELPHPLKLSQPNQPTELSKKPQQPTAYMMIYLFFVVFIGRKEKIYQNLNTSYNKISTIEE